MIFQQGYAFIGVKGKKKGCIEERAANRYDDIQTTQIFKINNLEKKLNDPNISFEEKKEMFAKDKAEKISLVSEK